jgi:fibronectin-binding autotransporter adhesin
VRLPKGGRGRASGALAALPLAVGLFVPQRAEAGDGTWTGAGTQWATGTNWSSTPAVPDGTATFTSNGASTAVSVGGGSSVSIGSMLFDAGAPGYTFSLFNTLSITGAGIVNNSSDAPGFTNSALLQFSNGSTAGNAVISNLSGLAFRNSSTAGESIVTNIGGTSFRDTSQAGTATITNKLSLQFLNGSTAGNATITNNDHATVEFNDASSSGNASIINNSGGTIYFYGGSKGGTGTITNNGDIFVADSGSAGSTSITNNSQLQLSLGGTAGSASITNNATLRFIDGSTAGSATITNTGAGATSFSGTSSAGAGTIANSGLLNFFSRSRAGSATINNVGGGVFFQDQTTAENARININGGGVTFQFGSTAANARITNDARLNFTQGSTAANATITTNSGATTGFFDTSTGASAQFAVNGTGVVDFTWTQGRNNDFQVSAGSIEGDGTVIIGARNTLTVGGNNLSTGFGGILSGNALVKAGTGTLTLTGANTYIGGTTVQGGALQIGNAGSIVGDVTNNAVLAFNRADTLAFGGAISGSGSLQQNGAGTTILTGASSHTGGTTINAGTLQIGNGGIAGSLSGDVTNNAALAFNRADTQTFAGAISGTGALQQNGLGTTILTGSSTHTGGTTINAGTLQIGAGSTTGSLAGNVSNRGTLSFNRSDTMTFGGAVSGTGAVQQAGGGTTILTGTSSYSGATTVASGTLIVNGSIASSAGVAVAAGATLGGSGTVATTLVNGTLSAGNSPGTLTVAGDLTLAANSTSRFELGAPGVVGGATNDLVVVNGNLSLGGTLQTPNAVSGYYRLFNVSGTTSGAFAAIPTSATVITNIPSQVNLLLNNGGQLVQFWDGPDSTGNDAVDGGAGAFNATGTNWTGAPGAAGINDSWRGQVGVFAGTAGTVTASGPLAFQGLQFSTTGYTLMGGALMLSGNPYGNAAASFVNVDGGATATIAAAMSGAGVGLDKLGAGTLVLTGQNTYTGPTTILAGTLQIGDGGTTGSVAGDVVNNALLVFNRSNASTFDGAISGTGSLQQNGSGTTILTGASIHSGGTTVNAGTLQIGDGGTTGSLVSNVINNAVLAFNRSDRLAFGGTITGTGSLQQNGFGTTILTGTGSHSGGTTVNAGTLQIGDGGMTGSLAGNVVNNAVLAFNRADTLAFGGTISGTGSLQQNGLGTTILTGTGSHTGGTTVNDGMLQIGNGGSTGSLAGNVVNNAVLAFNRADTLAFGGTITGAGSLQQNGFGTTILTGNGSHTGGTTVNAGMLQIGNGSTSGSLGGNVIDNSVLAFNRADTITFGGAISGTGSLQQNGFGTTILTGASTHTGGTTVNAGTLQVGNGSTSGSLSGNVINNSVLAFNRADTMTFGGAMSGSGSLRQSGSGTTILTGASSHTGGTTIDAGTLQIGDGGTTGSLAGTVINNATLVFNRADRLTFDGAISGSGAVQQAGSGTTILADASTYSGVTTVSAGTLIVNGSIASSAGVMIAAGATLGGSGTVATTVIDGTLSAGNGPGAFTVAGDLTLGASSTSRFELGTPGVVGGASNDLVVVNGNLTLGGTLDTPNAASGYYRLFNVSGVTSGAFAATPAGATVTTNIPNQVNLLLRNGGQLVQFWDGTDFIGNGSVNGGAGTFNASQTNWTGGPGAAGINDSWRGQVGVFAGSAGTAVVSGPLAFQGLQFSTTGTTLAGDTLTLSGNPHGNAAASFVNVDGGVTATIAAAMSGAGVGLDKLGAGALVLTGRNTYAGPTTILAGTLQIGDGGTSGSIAGNVVNNAVLAFNRSDSLVFDGAISGTGSLQQKGPGTTILTGTSSHTGGTAINAGTLQVGSGSTSGSLAGNVINNAVLAFNRADTMTFGGAVSGTGSLRQSGSGTTILTGTSSHTGGTTIDAGTLQIGDGGTAGSLSGAVINNATLAINRADRLILDSAISGTGVVEQAGPGTTILTGNSAYSGATTVSAGTLIVNGSIASSAGVTVAAGATLGGSGTVAAAVINGTLSAGNSAGALTVAGDLTLGAGSTSRFELGTPGIVGGANNDLVVVNGNLTLGGTLETPNAVSGYYRLFNVAGTTAGTFAATPAGATVTTSIPHQVNLLLQNSGQPVQFWDGTDLSGNGTGNGGTGTFNATHTNWTGAPGAAGINDSWRGGVGVFSGTAGTVTVSGPLAFQGLQFSTAGTTLAGDALTLSGNPLGNAAASFVNVDGGVTATIAAAMSGAGVGLDKLGAGTLVLTGENTYTGPTTISAGTLQLGDGGATGSIRGDILNNATLAINRADTVSLDHVILGTGALRQIGTGTTVLGGINTYTGATTVDAGALIVNGSIAASSLLTVNGGGLVAGLGALPTTMIGAGTLLPGSGSTIGTITIAGDLTLTAGSNYVVKVSPSSADRTDVTGTAVLDGRLTPVATGGNYTIGKQYVVLNATGGVTGTFSTTDLAGLFGPTIRPRVSYDSNNVFLDLDPNAITPYLPAATSGNARNVAGALDALFQGGHASPAFLSLFNLTASAVPAALTQLSGAAAAATPNAVFQTSEKFLTAMLDPFWQSTRGDGTRQDRAFAFAAEGPTQMRLPEALRVHAAHPNDAARESSDSRWSAWGSAVGAQARLAGDAATGSHDQRITSGGLAAGIDYRASGDTILGVAVAGGATRWSLAGANASGHGDSVQAGLYASTRHDNAYLAAALTYGRHDLTADRSIVLPGTFDRLTAAFTAHNLGVRAEAGYRFAPGPSGHANFSLMPYAAVQVQSLWMPAYAERDNTGLAGFALSYAAQTVTDTRSELGARVESRQDITADAALILRARAAWMHDYTTNRATLAAFQALPGFSFSAAGTASPRDAAQITTGAELAFSNGVGLLVKFDGEFADRSRLYGASGAVRVRW